MKRQTLPKTWIFFFIIIVILVIGAWLEAGLPSSHKKIALSKASSNTAELTYPRHEDFKLGGSGSSIELTDQIFQAKFVFVKAVTFASPGFVTLYSDDHGMPGAEIGVSGLIHGAKEGLMIPTSIQLQTGQIYYAMMRKDDGDGIFDENKDVPISDEKSTVILVNFVADLTKTTS